MVNIKSFNNLVLDILEHLRLTQPNMDTKPNTVARDLFVDGQALQISGLYDAIRQVSNLQSIANLSGQDLTNYGSNYSVDRRTGTKSIGSVLFTFRSLSSDVSIPAGSVVRTRQGIPFLTISAVTALTSQANALRATATRFRQQLDTAGITDEFAIEVSVQAQSQGSQGNVAAYSVISHSVSGVNSVTNIVSFTGGTDLESDATYRSRILATFAGANVGTALGYRSVVLDLPSSIDALVVEPGDPLMIRDGTVTTTDSYGNLIVSEPGTGGRVDIYVMGENPQSGTDSFVYNDQSGTGDAANIDNDFVLGQSSLTADDELTLNSRRVATLSEGAAIPKQPVTNIVSVSGSVSGPNFVEQFTDSAGNLQGNYVLIKDTGSAGGSPFGLDKFRWTSNSISLTDESRNKGKFNGLDGLAFTDVSEIPAIRQDIQVTNENSRVSSNRASVTTLHNPVRTVSRVFNVTTGERYTITDQNPDSDDELNPTGRVTISGRTLPTVSDVLQVDYTWVYEFDPYIDFDNLNPKDPLNPGQDSIEWGFSNYIRDEDTTLSLDSYNNLTLTTVFPISSVLTVNTFESETSTVVQTSTGKTVTVSQSVTNVQSIIDTSLSGNPEVFNTKEDDGNFSNVVITLPSDTLAQNGDSVTVLYNTDDLLDVDGYDTGLILNNQITLLPHTVAPNGTAVKVSYVADFLNLLPQTDIADLPISTDSFNSFTGVDGYQPVQNDFSGGIVTINKRRSPSPLRVTVSGIPNQGTLRFVGTTINKHTGVYTATSGNLDLSILIREAENLSNTAAIPAGISIARVVSVEKVSLTTANLVSSVDLEYDLTNYGIRDSKWDRANAIEVPTISRTAVQLAATEVNTDSDNVIRTGTILRVTFYYSKVNDTEEMFFSRNGTFITDKRFGHVSSINRILGFQDSGGTISGKLTIDSFNQPLDASTYFADYDYTAPKENERITINYEFNQLIVDATLAIEDNRPITADVLVKAATEIELDAEVSIVVSEDFKDRKATVRQDVADNVTTTLTATALGTTLDSSDIVDNAYNVEGVDRVRVTRFNKTGELGTKLSISAQKSEYFAPGEVVITVEDR